MRTRGKILREPGAGSGLLMIEGQQFRFSVASAWKSETPPKQGLVVEVELDRDLQVIAVKTVPEAQLANEQNEKAQAIASKPAEKRAGRVRRLISKIAPGVLARWRQRATKQENSHGMP
jgi:hypothetical protein